MNNIKQKNVIYGRDQKDVLPHAGKGDSVALVQNSNITDARMNNAFQQLVNNDLYIENRLVAGLDYQPGPEGAGTASIISAFPDGTKRWAETDDYTKPLQIYKKVEVPLSESIGLVRGEAVSFIAPIGGAVFAAFSDKLMYDAGGGLVECMDSDGASVAATGYCDGDGGAFFVSDASVYRLVQLPDTAGTGVVSYSLQKLNQKDIAGHLKCVQYDAQGGMLYIGGRDGFAARGRYSSSSAAVNFTQDIKFCADDVYGKAGDTSRYVNDITVNALQALDRQDYSVNVGQRQTNIVAATSGGMFRSDTRFFLEVKESSELNGKTCLDVIQHEGAIYALVSDALGSNGRVYKQTDAGSMSFSEYSSAALESPVGFVSHQSGLYVVCGGGIYRYVQLGEDPVIELEYEPPSPITAAAVVTLFGERMVLAAAGGTVYYYSDPAKARPIQFDGCSSIKQVAAQARAGDAGSFDIYAIGENGSGEDRLFAAYVGFSPQKTVNADEIDAIELVEPGVESAVCGGPCYYFKDGTIYNSETGQSKRLGDISVRRMEYMQSANGLILATDSGLQVFDAKTFDVICKDVDVADVKFASHHGSVICFATSTGVYISYKDGSRLGAPVLVGEVGGEKEIAGVVTDGGALYALGKQIGAAAGETGALSSACIYYVRSIATGSSEGGDADTARMAFPVMPFMAETSSGTALGISGGTAYRLAYGAAGSCQSVDFGIGDINAFCLAGSHVFAAAADGVIRQYECSAAAFDPGEISTLTEVARFSGVPGVSRMEYSGTDTTFDMRIYAQFSGGGLSVHTPAFQNIRKCSADTKFSDFIMYVDCQEGEEGEEDEGGASDDKYFAVIVGTTSADASLHIISALVGGSADEWSDVNEVSRALPDVDISAAGGPQQDRTPYQLFFADDAKVYVAYTAKTGDSSYSDYILAVNTADLLSGGVGGAEDFARLGRYESASHAGVSRFTGFNIPGSDDDVDVIATCYRDGPAGYVLATFKVDANIAGQKIADCCAREYFLPDTSYKCFQPDCARHGSDYFIAVPAVTPDGNTLRTYMFRYNGSSNTCSKVGSADVEGVGGVEISGVYLSMFKQDSASMPELVVVDAGGRAFYVTARVGETVQWSGDSPAASPVLDGTEFKRVVRSGIRQLVGLDAGGSLVYDFQSRVKQVPSGLPSAVLNVYATDTDEARNYMLIQDEGGIIYSIDPKQELSFNPVGGLAEGRKTLLKANGSTFVVVQSEISAYVYREEPGGGFELMAEGGVSPRFGGEYVDVQIFYGVIQERSYAAAYYVFFLKQSGDSGIPDGVDVYAMSGNGEIKALERVCEFENQGDASFFSYISYIDGSFVFDAYTRKTAYNSLDHYDWPIIARQDGSREYMYLDFSGAPQIKCSRLSDAGEQCVGVGNDGETAYCVKIESNKAAVYHVGAGGGLIGRCDEESTFAWLVGGKCIFQKKAGGILYYDGEAQCSAGDGQYELVDRAGAGPYYFVQAADGARNLYKSVSVAVYPVRSGPVFPAVMYVAPVSGDAFVRLASGKTYAGLVRQNDSGVRSLHILWPTDEFVTPWTGDGGGAGAPADYSVYVCPVSFSEFPDGRANPDEIVPVGGFLDEIIAYEGGYLHIARVSESKLITDKTGTSVVPVVSTLPWTELGASFKQGISASAKLNGRRYVTSGTGLSSFVEGSSGIAMKILSPAMKAGGVNARSFYQTGQNAFLVATDKGVYRYQHIEGAPVVGRLSPGDGYDAAQVTSYNFAGALDTYVMANALDGYLYSSENCRVWKKQFRPAPASAKLCAVYPKNAREWYFGASSGLYKSTYRYSEVDDLAKFTEDDLYSLYAEMLSSDISSRREDEISRHELDGSYALGHLSSLMYDINQNLLSVNFDGLQSSGWQRHSGAYSAPEYSVSNDIVFEQFWGSNADWNLALSVENMFVSADNAKFTYLFRRWMSGITELYVHIPTTNTYYVNHVPSTPNYSIDEDSTELSASNVTQFGRNKTVFRHNPNAPGVYTTIRLALSKYMFFIDQLLEVQACGNSLPLKIYKETIRENGSDNDFRAAQYFNSYVAPTVLTSMVDPDGGDDYIFSFACFGADEQVIKLQFIDTVNRFDQEYCRLVFDSNGLNSDPDSFVKQRIRLDGQPYTLRRNQYQWPQDQQLFAGWTFTPYPPANPDISSLNGFYSDKQQITSTEIENRCGFVASGQDVKIYAVWITYQFGEGDTTMLMSPRPDKTTFKLGSADTITDQRIGDKIIIKFEEVD